MKYFEELKYEQISEILGTSVGALKASYHAVKKIEVFVMAIKPFVNNQVKPL
jgi:RNA polymerase sigma-70 factor (ECF subfamily)